MSVLHYIRPLLLLCIITLLSACSDDTEKNIIDEKKALLDQAEIILSEAGIGSINAQTPFNIHQITQAFQSQRYHVEQIQTKTDDIDYPVIRVSKGTDTLLLINPALDQEKIFSIVIKDKRVGNSLGHEMGTEYGAVYSYGNLEQCSAGVESLSGKVLCYAPKSANVLYMFGDENPNSFPDGELPPVDALDSWKLEAIIWKPKK